MSEIADRYRRVAARFTARVEGVPPGGWEAPAPCEGWVARDVVGHLVDWVPGMFEGFLVFPATPSVDEDPAGAWRALSDTLQAALDDPKVSARPFSHPQAGDHRMDEAIDRFCLGDVLIHTWDLARATGQDEMLDPDEVRRAYEGMAPMVDVLVASGHFAEPVPVPDDVDLQAKLIALTGRRS